MASFKRKEQLIQEAASGNDAYLKWVYDRFYMHYKAESHTQNNKSYDDCRFIEFLYTKNHKGKSFKAICDKYLFTSVSTLEARRKEYVSIFYFYLENEKAIFDAAFASNL